MPFEKFTNRKPKQKRVKDHKELRREQRNNKKEEQEAFNV